MAVKEIQRIMSFSTQPEWVRINRLIHCMPQYNVGHRAGITAVREHVAKHYPNLHLIGTPFDGDVYKRQHKKVCANYGCESPKVKRKASLYLLCRIA